METVSFTVISMGLCYNFTMTEIKRLSYDNRRRKDHHFEILPLEEFMASRPHEKLEAVKRLDFWVIIYVTEGSGRHFVDFEEYPYKAEDILVLRKNQVHRFCVNLNAKGYIMVINEPFIYEGIGDQDGILLDFLNRPFKLPIISIENGYRNLAQALAHTLLEAYRTINISSGQNLYRSILQSFVLSVQEDTARVERKMESKATRTFNKFYQLVEKHYMDLKTVSAYAELMMVSSKTINLATREAVGMTAKSLIIERLILEVKRLISEGDMLTYEISDRLGFDEPSNMTKFFKKQTGMSPSEFKKTLKNVP